MIIIPIIIIISVHRSLITIKFSNYNVQCRSNVHTTTTMCNGDINWIEFQFIIIFQYFRLSMMSKTMRHDVICFYFSFLEIHFKLLWKSKMWVKKQFWTITEYGDDFPENCFCLCPQLDCLRAEGEKYFWYHIKYEWNFNFFWSCVGGVLLVNNIFSDID